MATVTLTDEEWYTVQSERVLDALRAWLPREGATVATVKAKLRANGFAFTDAEFAEIGNRLVAAGHVEITQ